MCIFNSYYAPAAYIMFILLASPALYSQRSHSGPVRNWVGIRPTGSRSFRTQRVERRVPLSRTFDRNQ
ncbi:hypothetical protein CPC08DRAFT_338378 [Agrocybe pediades]|nr:hypothetical protein CPC08DRAFT_338378 [Agrocybe pediades]